MTLEGQRSSFLFARQIATWASRTASRVARDTPGSASAATLALSPACSSSTTATRTSYGNQSAAGHERSERQQRPRAWRADGAPFDHLKHCGKESQEDPGREGTHPRQPR
jgi:hypothetical protein